MFNAEGMFQDDLGTTAPPTAPSVIEGEKPTQIGHIDEENQQQSFAESYSQDEREEV